jgi:hypothetical protein
MDRPLSLSEPPKSRIRKVFAKCRVNCYVTRSITDLADVIRGLSGLSFFPAKTKRLLLSTFLIYQSYGTTISYPSHPLLG